MELFENDKVYRNSDLVLGNLAARLEISTHKLSEVINRKLGKTFYDFVNGFRVQEIKEAISGEKLEKYNLLSIAIDSGFSSKSSFNTTF